MGGCVRKQTLVYQQILSECFELLNSGGGGDPTRALSKQKALHHNYNLSQQKLSDGTNDQGVAPPHKYRECTAETRAKAYESYETFTARPDLVKLESQIKLHARTLSDHIEDTHVRLIDTMIYLRQQLVDDVTDYGMQWTSIIILEVLVENLKNYTQKHISLKQGNLEESIVASKQDNFTEVVETAAVIAAVAAAAVTAAGRENNPNSSSSGVDQITFFSDNFIRFEMDFIEISLFLLNGKANPFYAQSQTKFLSILRRFSTIHKDPYSSERIISLVEQLEEDIETQAKSILSESKTDITAVDAKRKINDLSNLMQTYVATIAKVKIHQKVFRSHKQLAFFYFILQTVIEFNQLKDAAVVGKPINAPPQSLSSPQQLTDSINVLTSTCLRVVGVFARRSCIIKNYGLLLQNLLGFFDKVRWDTMLRVEEILEETISVARLEAVYLNYKVYLMEQLVDYLTLGKSCSGSLNPQSLLALQYQQDIINSNGVQSEITAAAPPLKLVNFSEAAVKIRVLEIFDRLVHSNDREIPLLAHSTGRIMRCYLENLRDADISQTSLREALNRSFEHYVTTLATDCSQLVTTISMITSEISDFINTSSQARNPHGITANHSHINVSFVTTPRIVGRKSISPAAAGFVMHHANDGHAVSASESLRFISEGLLLVHTAIGQAKSVQGSYFSTDEVIINLLYVSNIKKVSLLAFSAITRVALLHSIVKNDSVSSGLARKEISGSSSTTTTMMSAQFSYHSLLHLLFQAIRCAIGTAQNDGGQSSSSVVSTAMVFSYVKTIVGDIARKGTVMHVRVIVAFLMKLIQEASAYQVSHNHQEAHEELLSATKKNSEMIQAAMPAVFAHASKTQMNIVHSTIYEIIQVIESNGAATSDNKTSLQEPLTTAKPPAGLKSFNETLSQLIEVYEKQFSDDKLLFVMPQFKSSQVFEQTIERLAEQLEEMKFIKNTLLENGLLHSAVVQSSGKLGFLPEQDFDAMTAQLSKNFTQVVSDLELVNVHPDEEGSFAGGRMVSRKRTRGETVNATDQERVGGEQQQFEELLDDDDDDSQFGNILNMIQRRAPALPALAI